MSTVLAIAIIVAVAVWIGYAFRRRSAALRTMRGPLGGGNMTARALGSAVDISDGGQVPAWELFGALRVAEVPELDAEGEPNLVAGLGLTLHEGSTGSTNYSTQTRTPGRPQVMEGKRNGHQVFILQGEVGGGGVGVAGQKLRAVSCVRVDAPAFQLDAEDGSLRWSADAPGEVVGVVSDLSRSPDVWHHLRVTSGSRASSPAAATRARCSRAGSTTYGCSSGSPPSSARSRFTTSASGGTGRCRTGWGAGRLRRSTRCAEPASPGDACAGMRQSGQAPRSLSQWTTSSSVMRVGPRSSFAR